MYENMNKDKYILWFKEISIEDVPIVGGKNASLGEMYRNLTKKGVSIPNGFAITADAYRYLLEKDKISQEIKSTLKDLDVNNLKQLSEKGSKIRKMIRTAEIPQDLEKQIIDSYYTLSKQEKTKELDVAVRSSATAEDLPDASFAGQQETYLNIRGPEELLDACKKCFASLFTNRAIAYRVEKKFDHTKVALSITVQKMVRSDLASSGVMFSIDTETGFRDAVVINGAYGLGENVVQGAVNPDEFMVFKPTLKQGKNAIISKRLGEKAIKMVYDTQGNKPVKNINVDINHRNQFCITDKDVITLAKWACIIEDYYSQKAGHYKPMDMEWAIDGVTKKVYIVQARPETVQSNKNLSQIETYSILEEKEAIVTGISIGQKIATGNASIIKDVKDINKFKKGDILITEMTDPDWVPIMKIASGIVTNKGGKTCHAAIIARELGIPCIVGTIDATLKIKDKSPITIDCSSGDYGFVYEGTLKFKKDVQDIKKIPITKTKIMLNVGNPEQALEQSFLPADGVGLAREEFIINSWIKIHPLALINYNKIKDKKVKEEIDKLTIGYSNKVDYFVDKLSQGIARIAAAFYPKKVILRTSDFKTDEYANLIGGKEYEPIESNPMLGWRGASRYYQGNYREGFALECKAIKRVREDMGLTNLEVMIPFCRTLDEAKKVIAELKKNGLEQGKNGLKVIGMCEIPSNVILAEEFLNIFDGFSIGSNDLTQLTLGLDRNSEIVASIYDERNPAVKELITNVVKIAKKKKKYIGICGQAPSDYPDFAEFLVSIGIDSMSLNPDTLIKTKILVANKEKSKK
ncbi:phosphoenolpyruvate synthase [archaeon]|nr:phosphoenolpyruvate synthase [archaeon]NCP79432.1 phosphoenolpyruvate synthase [archaeon]NCP97375.1 phosphoenolpyruvate synthase [archaeon]NCQ07199.1 phosphoenolpyruvate synthase [archaeon]NCQ50995.1 phosphoenolpyruvate synthase [archaeon]